MLAEIKRVGSKRLENLSGHRINRPPSKQNICEKRQVQRLNP